MREFVLCPAVGKVAGTKIGRAIGFAYRVFVTAPHPPAPESDYARRSNLTVSPDLSSLRERVRLATPIYLRASADHRDPYGSDAFAGEAAGAAGGVAACAARSALA